MSTQREIAEDWLKYTITGWQKTLRRLRIKNTDELYNSFAGEVLTSTGGDVEKVKLAYAWYGQMVDMGVGRGTRQGDQRDNATMRRVLGSQAGKSRRPKPWYSKGKDGIGNQQLRLAQLLGKVAADEATEKVNGSLLTKVVINF